MTVVAKPCTDSYYYSITAWAVYRLAYRMADLNLVIVISLTLSKKKKKLQVDGADQNFHANNESINNFLRITYELRNIDH